MVRNPGSLPQGQSRCCRYIITPRTPRNPAIFRDPLQFRSVRLGKSIEKCTILQMTVARQMYRCDSRNGLGCTCCIRYTVQLMLIMVYRPIMKWSIRLEYRNSLLCPLLPEWKMLMNHPPGEPLCFEPHTPALLPMRHAPRTNATLYASTCKSIQPKPSQAPYVVEVPCPHSYFLYQNRVIRVWRIFF